MLFVVELLIKAQFCDVQSLRLPPEIGSKWKRQQASLLPSPTSKPLGSE